MVWILDEDKDTTSAVVDGGNGWLEERATENILTAAHLVHERSGADIVLGRDTGAAPLPALCTLRTQLVDLLANLHMLARLSPRDAVPCRSRDNAEAARRHADDFYHDLACCGLLESPFWMQPERADGGEAAAQMFDRIAHGCDAMLGGRQLFRPLFATEPKDMDDILRATAPSVRRGGNTFVFALDALRVPNMLAPHRTTCCRRSDFIWCMLNVRRGR